MNATRTIENRVAAVLVLVSGIASGLVLTMFSQVLEPDRTVVRALQENMVILLLAGSAFSVLPLVSRLKGVSAERQGVVSAGLVGAVQALVMAGMMVSEVLLEGRVFVASTAGLFAAALPSAVLAAVLAFLGLRQMTGLKG